jgi:dipeptidyl aminopeptidase/acylaminoacyl peptidase
MLVSGGEAQAITRYGKTDIVYCDWAPDGQSLAFLMPEPPDKKKRKARKQKNDTVLWDQDYDFVHLYWLPVTEGAQPCSIKQLTKGRFHIFGMAWMPQGNAIAITHQPTPLADDWPKSSLAILPFDESAENKPIKKKQIDNIATVALWGGHPFPSPDGAWIACSTADTPLAWAGANHVILYAPDGSQTRVLSPTPDGQSWVIGWSKDGSHVYVGETWGLDAHVWALPVNGEPAVPVLNTPTFKCAFHTPGNDRMVYAEESFLEPNALWLIDLQHNQRQLLSTPALPEKWPEGHLPMVKVRTWKAQDGLEIESIVIYPLDYNPGQRYPLIVEVHGGPMGVFNRRYLGWSGRYCDVLAAAERGFVILRVNPRGSSGYGKDFRFANYGDWGYGDFNDIMACVDGLIEEGIVDSDRMGMMGWSYGGFMTSWTITQTDRFKAACVGAGVTNLMSFNGTSDIPGFLPDYFAYEFWHNLEPYQRHSPMFNVESVTTPTLIQHGMIDERVPLEQGLQLYNALKRQQVPVEMVLYPRQHHSIAEPRLRIDMRKRPITWFSKWLLKDLESPSL